MANPTAANLMYEGGNWTVLITPGVVATATEPLEGGTFNYTESSSWQGHPAKNKPMIKDMANKIYDEDFDTMLDTYLSNQDNTLNTFSMEDSMEVDKSAALAAAKYLVCIDYSAKVNGKVCVTAGYGNLSGDTGNMSSSSKSLVDAPVQFTTAAADQEYTIAAAVVAALSNGKITTGATITIASGAYGARAWISV